VGIGGGRGPGAIHGLKAAMISADPAGIGALGAQRILQQREIVAAFESAGRGKYKRANNA
jgi:hypothetical protein